MSTEPTPDAVHAIDMGRVIRIIFVSCLTVIVALVVCDYLFNYLSIVKDRDVRRIFNIAREHSLPTWFASVQAQLLGVTVLLIAAVQSRSVSRFKTLVWVLIGLLFVWIGIDDAAEIHERLGGALERMAHGGAVGELLLQNPSYAWHGLIAPLYALCGLGIAVFLWSPFWRLKLTRYLILGLGCWAVAQGMDFVEGLDSVDTVYDRVQEWLGGETRRYAVTHTFKVVEEVLEMLGTTLLWMGFLSYLADVADGLELRFRRARPGSAEAQPD
jgi:hypothetical protein